MVRAAVLALRTAPRRPAGDRARRQLGLAMDALVLRAAALRGLLGSPVRLVAAGCAAPSHDLANRLILTGNQPRVFVFVDF